MNSVLLALLASGLCVIFGGVASLWLASLRGARRNLIWAASLLPLMLPPFLLVGTWIGMAGKQGWLSAWLPFEIYSFSGTVLLLFLAYWPVMTLFASSALSALPKSLLELDGGLQGRALVRKVLLPLIRPALLLAWVVCFVLSLNDFSIPVILQTSVFTTEVWLRFNTYFDAQGALLLCWPLVVFPFLLLIWAVRRQTGRMQLAISGENSEAMNRFLGNRILALGRICWGVCMIGSVGLPLVHLMTSPLTWSELGGAFQASQDVVATTLTLGVVSAALVMGAGWMLSKYRIGVVTWFPFLLPGVFVGMFLIAALNRPSMGWLYVGRGVMVCAVFVRYLALGWLGARWLRGRMNESLSEWAQMHGASLFQKWCHGIWPQCRNGLLAVGIAVYLLSLWDAETVVMIVPAGGETLSLRIFNLLHYGHNEQVNALCLLLIGVGVLPLVLIWVVNTIRHRQRQVKLAMVALLAVGTLGCGSSDRETGDDSIAELSSQFFEKAIVLGSRGVGPGEFNKPRSIAVDLQDHHYVVDMTGRVQKFDPAGNWILAWQMPETKMGRPKGMCLDADGNVVVVEPHYARVNHFSHKGELLLQWGDFGTEEGRLVFPRTVTCDPEGRMLVAEYSQQERVQRFSTKGTDGQLLSGGPERGLAPGQFNRPEGLSMDPDGNILVADSCNHRVQILSPDGTWLKTLGGAGSELGQMSFPYDVRCDAEGHLFVCEFGNSRIQIFDTDYTPLETIGGPGNAPGQFHNPWSLALDSDGNLYVADSANHRVQKLIRRKGGSGRIFFGSRPVSQDTATDKEGDA